MRDTSAGVPKCVSSSGRARTKPRPLLGSSSACNSTPRLAEPRLVAASGMGLRPKAAMPRAKTPRPNAHTQSAPVRSKLSERVKDAGNRLDLAAGTRTLRRIMGSRGPMDQFTAHLDRGWDLVNRGDFAGALISAQKSLE